MNDAPAEQHPWWEGDYVWRPGEVPVEPAEEPASSAPPRTLIPCWHCGKLVEPGTTVCIFCRTPLGGVDLPRLLAPLSPDLRVGLTDRLHVRTGLASMLGFFAALLLLTFGHMTFVKLLIKNRTLPTLTMVMWLALFGELLS